MQTQREDLKKNKEITKKMTKRQRRIREKVAEMEDRQRRNNTYVTGVGREGKRNREAEYT